MHAAGEFGTVDKYEYLDKNNIKTTLALKLLNRDLLANETDVNNFVNEMRTLKKVCSLSCISRLCTNPKAHTLYDNSTAPSWHHSRQSYCSI